MLFYSVVQVSYAQPLRIAVSANFHPLLKQLLPQYEQKNIDENNLYAHQSIELISGASGVLFQQIRYGAPFDIFLSADSTRPQQLIQENKALSASLFTYAIGQLSLWSSHTDLIQSTETVDAIFKQITLKETRLAIANPNTAPYGKAAKEVLSALALWPSYQPNLVIGLNINQTFQQVRSGAAHYGIIATSQLKLNKINNAIQIPQRFYTPIKQQGVILTRSKQRLFAEHFMNFLQSEDVQKQFIQYGYLPSDTITNTANEAI